MQASVVRLVPGRAEETSASREVDLAVSDSESLFRSGTIRKCQPGHSFGPLTHGGNCICLTCAFADSHFLISNSW